VALNLANRQKAISVAMYGPANPGLLNEAYWAKLAAVWGISPDEARSMRCGNCAFFDVTAKARACIAAGLEASDTYDFPVAGTLGYCRAFHFKCAGARTCSAWVAGGPIKDR
jgi:hypothetical protein